MNYKSIVFREFTQESLQRIKQYRQEEAEQIASERLQQQTIYEDDINEKPHLNKSSKDEPIEPNRVPNKELAVGQTLPRVLQHRFPPELIGKPIEEIDSYYRTEYVFVVVDRSHTIFRFSATRACFIFSPFNCFRRLAIRILTHTLFSTVVMLTILANCIFMTLRNAPEVTEYIFTIIYTFEALTKCIARGFILQKYTFLRDPWNWLDFIVITFAYITFFINLGKVAVLRTFRVLRALKTVAVIPGLKIIVNALIQSFIALRDVAVLSSFILSIFALIGLQLYMGILRQKCVLTYKSFLNNSKSSNIGFNMSYESYLKALNNESNWYQQDDLYVLCGNSSGSTKCPDGYVCWKDRGISPDFGYTSFDNYGWAMLACFRLMTQDYWENLYQIVLSAAGRYHFFYFLAVIFFGSFYLINLILAIVSMSYFEQQKQIEIENKELERPNWYQQDDLYVLCGNSSGSTKCPDGYVCWKDRGISPDFGYTSFDNYGWAMLACFRLMTQDYWENLYQIVLSAAGRYHFFYFLAVIFFGSFYLINLILAIVSMSYFEQQKQIEIENKELERRKIEDELEIQNEEAQKALEAQSHLHTENTPCNDDLDRRISHCTISIEYKQNENTNNSNNMRLSQTISSIHQFNKSHFSLSNTLINDDAEIMFIDDTRSNSPNESQKNRKTKSSSHICERNQNYNDSIVTAIITIFVLDAFFDLFITICIILNTLFMALDHHGQSELMTRILVTGNYIFTAIFTAECVLKIIALTPAKYLRNGWNVFDLVIVTVSVIELGLAGVKGLSVLRSFRLLRVFKLAKSWQTLNRLMSIIAKSIGALGNLTLVLVIIIFIFAVMGMQLFGQKYYDKFGKDIPRWNFFDFFHAFMIVFRVLCGEWIESMWVCLECAGWPCVPFFLLTFVIGNLVILNLFLALLLASFGSSVLTEKEDEEENKIA
ncbi:unnamed protein product [Rotaria sp. Silwood1]|nr:unnamed protein product [Rotaria sp. Silwood1]